ncbi:MAG: hypothetical protein ACJAVR_000333 [Paracoccaceae bacterium]|jgi:hypothetical protein
MSDLGNADDSRKQKIEKPLHPPLHPLCGIASG